MMSKAGRSVGLLIVLFFAAAGARLNAASFVVPPDREMVRQADAIVIASALHSRTELRNNVIETVTLISVDEVLKGSMHRETIEIYEPGGAYEKRVTTIPGVPRFKDGERYVLFLTRAGSVWRVADLVLGKFTFATDTSGHEVLMRDLQEIAGWDPDGKTHREQNREATAFVDFIRITAKGGPAREEYMIPAESLIATPDRLFAQRHTIVPLCTSGCSPTSYTYVVAATNGARWASFPVSFFSTNANGNAVTAMNNAMAAWDNDPNSNVQLVNAGADVSGMHTGGVVTADGQNTVAFEEDLHAKYGAFVFSCTASSYSGTLGIAGVTNTAGSHTGPNSETFFTTSEGDVEMNAGLSNCTFFINLGDFDSAVAHELGHTLGFRHSDEDRSTVFGGAGACASDPSLECSSSAIMKAFIPTGLHGNLQTWDQHAVAAVYPQPVGGPSPVTSVEAHATASNSVQVSWVGSCSLACHIYRSSDHVNFSLLPTTPTSSPFNDTTAAPIHSYLYKVRAFNGTTESSDSNNDLATTVIFSTDPLVANSTSILGGHLTEIRAAVNAVEALAATGPTSFTDTPPDGQPIQALHITQMRTALDVALPNIGRAAGGYTDSLTANVTPVKAIHFQELRDRVK